MLSPHHPERLDPTRGRPGLPFGVLRLRLLHAAALHRRGIRAGGGARPLQVTLPRYAASSLARAIAPDQFSFHFLHGRHFGKKIREISFLYKKIKFSVEIVVVN